MWEGIDLDSSFLSSFGARKYSMEGHWKFWGVGWFQKLTMLKERVKLNSNFWRDGEGSKIFHEEGMDIFWTSILKYVDG